MGHAMSRDLETDVAALRMTSEARARVAPRHNERVRGLDVHATTAVVMLHRCYGAEPNHGYRLVVLAPTDTGAWSLVGESFLPTPGVLTSRRGNGPADNPRPVRAHRARVRTLQARARVARQITRRRRRVVMLAALAAAR